MKVFIAGATGYLGTAVAARLRRGGHDVSGLARSDSSAARLRAAGIRPVNGDLADPGSLARAAAGADAVVHLAQPAVAPGSDIRSVMGDLGRLQIDAVTQYLEVLPVGARLIFTSGAGGYGDTGPGVATEQTPVVSDPVMDGLATAERLVLGSAGAIGIVVRPVIVYGGGGGPIAMLHAMAVQSGAAYVLGAGDNPLTLVHLDDVAELYALLVERGDGGVYNAAAEPFVTQRQVVDAVAAAAGVGSAQPPPELAAALSAGPGIFTRTMRVAAPRALALGWRPRAVDLGSIAPEPGHVQQV